jgi:rhamnosyltransferase
MQVSVAMATYNGERFLADQLKSFTEQSRPPREVIVCDDASTDGTLDIVRGYARDAPFEVVIISNATRLGYGETFFRAIKKCRGDLIALSDQDDVWHRDKLSRCHAAFAVDANVLLATHSMNVVDTNLHPKGWCDPNIRKRGRIRAGYLRPFAGWLGCSLMFRSVVCREIAVDARPSGFWPGEGPRMAHDVWANLVCSALGDVALIPDNLVLYRRHESNASSIERRTRSDRVAGSLALHDEAVRFRHIALGARERAAYLETLRPAAAQFGAIAASGLERSIHRHQQYSNAMERRASAYERDKAISRVAGIARHAMRGDYGRRSSARLGLLSLARDVTLGATSGSRVTRDGESGGP